jgi:Flp pilus assembly protein CpaB
MQMRRQTVQLLGGVLLGLLGAGLVFMYVRGVQSRSEGQETRAVYVAHEVIGAGTAAVSLADLVASEDVAADLAPEGALTDLEEIRGHFSTEEIQPGETLMRSMFATAGTTEAGALAIPKGREAMAITATIDGGLAQYAAPGDHVSVYATFENREVDVTQKILADVPILATEPGEGNAAQELTGSANQLVFVLALTPDEAGRLVFAKETGSIWMTLVPEGQKSPGIKDITEKALKFRVRVQCDGNRSDAQCDITGRAT